MSIRRLAAALLVLVCPWAVPPVSGAPDWTTPVTLPFDAASQPVFGFAAGGVEFAARIQVAMPIDPNNVSTQLIVSRKSPGAAWVDELTIASTPTAVPAGVALAVAPNGAAVVAFGEGTSNDFSPVPPLRWRAVYRSAGGSWESPVTLFTDPIATPGGLGTTLLCAIAPDGTAVAGADHVEPDDSPSEPAPGQTDLQIDAAIHPMGDSWQPSQRLSAHNVSADFTPAIGIDDAGNFTLGWASRFSEGGTSSTSDDHHTILVRRRLAGQSIWNTAEDVTGSDITKDAFFNGLAFAVGPDGHAVVGYQYPIMVFGASRPDSVHTFSAPQQLITTGASSAPFAGGVAPDGTAYLLYEFQGNSSAEDHVGMVKLPPGGMWTAETAVSPLDFSGFGGGIGFVGNDAIAVWEVNDTAMTTHLIEASRWPAGSPTPEAYRDLEPLTSTQSVRQVLSDRAGSVVAIWTSGTNLRAAAFDAGGPQLASSSIPSPLTAGVAATFAVTFADLWSAVSGTPTWNFGDGTPAAGGASVDHAYAAPGAYTITASAIDALGNPGAATFAVNVGECEALAGVDSLFCRCHVGLGIAACTGETVPGALTKRFTAACGAIDAAKTGGAGKKGRKAAARAVKGFKRTAQALGLKPVKKLPRGCRDALKAVLSGARQNATAFKGTL